MMDLFYLSGTGGKKIDFVSDRYRANIQDLLQYEWEYDSSENTGRSGGRITGMKRGIASKPLSISVYGKNHADYIEALNELHSVFERDVQNLTPGRLYFGKSYLTCYLSASSFDSAFDPDVVFSRRIVTLISEYPFWCSEETFEYLPDSRETESAVYLDYPFDCPYDYLYDIKAGRQLVNDHFSESDFLMTVYGPANNPAVYIAGHKYEVKTVLYDGEYMIINSSAKKIYKVSKDGVETNLFNYRDKESDIFKKIASGSNAVIFNQSFGFSITLFKERSEPEWSI